MLTLVCCFYFCGESRNTIVVNQAELAVSDIRKCEDHLDLTSKKLQSSDLLVIHPLVNRCDMCCALLDCVCNIWSAFRSITSLDISGNYIDGQKGIDGIMDFFRTLSSCRSCNCAVMLDPCFTNHRNVALQEAGGAGHF